MAVEVLEKTVVAEMQARDEEAIYEHQKGRRQPGQVDDGDGSGICRLKGPQSKCGTQICQLLIFLHS
jgi:hypothetical protein